MLFARMLRAALLDRTLYAELRNDPVALAQGIIVMVLASVAAAIGGGFREVLVNNGEFGQGLIYGLVVMPGFWLVQAASAFMLGSVADPGPRRGTRRELLAAILFSSAPGVLLVLILLPAAAQLVWALVFIYMVISLVTAVRVVMDVPWYRAAIAVAPGFLLSFFLPSFLAG